MASHQTAFRMKYQYYHGLRPYVILILLTSLAMLHPLSFLSNPPRMPWSFPPQGLQLHQSFCLECSSPRSYMNVEKGLIVYQLKCPLFREVFPSIPSSHCSAFFMNCMNSPIVLLSLGSAVLNYLKLFSCIFIFYTLCQNFF